MQDSFILILLFGISLTLLFLHEEKSAWLLGLRIRSRLWVRIIGALGVVWVGLAVITNRELALFQMSADRAAELTMIRHYVAGAICGLFLAVYTKTRETRH
jgi:hypothetical protein